jgi:hypothetical protein
MKTQRKEYFGFQINEYRWRKIRFTRHFTREAAEKKHRSHFRHEVDPVSADVDPMVIEGREALEKWAEECGYRIDWTAGFLIHKDAEAK